MKFRAIIGDKALQFGSALAEARFYELKGKPVTIEIDDRPSAEMRRFFEGGVVVACFYQHPRSGWTDFKECREALKLEFLPGFTKDMHGRQVKYPRSTSELSKEGFRGFLGRIEVWFMENGLEWPSPDEYTQWRDSGALKGEVFPPLVRMQQRYEQEKRLSEPWKSRSVIK